MTKIFISYRRDDSAYVAQRIYKELIDHFGSESVIFDVDTIPFGTDFRKYLNNEVGKCDIFLTVIGNQWMDILEQRLNEPNDFVRIEVQAALEREIPVVPVLVGKASVPIEKNLPPELAGLSYRNAAEVRAGRDLQTHLKRLIDGLEGLLPEVEAGEKIKQKEEQKPEAVPKTYTNSIGMEFILIPSGIFTMGSSLGYEDQEPPHEVKISQSFYLQTTQVTQRQWKAVMGNNPSVFKDCGENCPVQYVSCADVQKFIEKLNEKEDTYKHRLPTEAEWEYACRAGTTTKFFFGDGEYKLTDYAWFKLNSNSKLHRVATKKPNPWGLYDMLGNVDEWIEDDWHEDYNGAPDDGRAWINEPRDDSRVIRGGGWGSQPWHCLSANREGIPTDACRSDVGFRLARTVALGLRDLPFLTSYWARIRKI